MSVPAGQAAISMTPRARRRRRSGAAALAAGDRTEALRDRPTESEELIPLAGSWLEIGLETRRRR